MPPAPPNPMAQRTAPLPVDSQACTFAEIANLEKRVAEIEGLVAVLKAHCLAGGSWKQPELVSAMADLRCHARQILLQVTGMEKQLGAAGPAAAPAPQTPQVAEPPRNHHGLRGTTESLSIPELVHMLTAMKKTGSLSIHAGETLYLLEFLEGAIVHAVTNRRSPEHRLGTILVAQNKLTAEQLQESLATVQRTNEMLGTQLVRTAMISESDLRAALGLQVSLLFQHLFALRDARFTFADGATSGIGQRVNMNTMQLLLETARRQDEGARGREPATAVPAGPSVSGVRAAPVPVPDRAR